MPWSSEQVLALAPDPSSAKAGKDLGSARKWASLGGTAVTAWGTIQGSGSKPYQTCIDLSEPAFKCTCPSRKFPCKHGLGLLLIVALAPGALVETTAPDWVGEWLTKREERRERTACQAVAPTAVSEEEAAAKAAAAQKRVVSREARVSAGLEELGLWLSDLVRTGFAALPGKPPSFWDNPAARLVDAQAPGLARRVGALGGFVASGAHWPVRLLREAAWLHLAAGGWSRLDSLPAPTQADLRAAVGFPLAQEEVLAGAGVRDQWLVLGRRIVEEDRLRTQRTWLWGAGSGVTALCLSFSATPAQPLDVSLIPGFSVEAELAFFPGAWPGRALVKQRWETQQDRVPALPHASVSEAMAGAGDAFAANPWLQRVAFGFTAVTVVRRSSGWVARDSAGKALPLQGPEGGLWALASLGGGRPIALTGEWDGEWLCPLAGWGAGRFLAL